MFKPDQPIESCRDDILGRSPFARALADAVLGYESKDSVVIGLFGAWGSGKTSIINMALEHIESRYRGGDEGKKPIVVRFNPWNYSDQDQLISQFFKQLSGVLKRADYGTDVRKAGEQLETYGRFFEPLVFIPKVGAVLAVGGKLIRRVGQAAKRWGAFKEADLRGIRGDLNELLRKQQRKIIVVIDDIDRLNNTEIRQTFQLIKSLADFPNTVYVLAFDKNVIIHALKEVQKGSGLEYLEKVVQLPCEVPLISKYELERLLCGQLDELIKDIPPEKWDRIYWGNIYHSGLKHFFQNVRDVTRYINCLGFTFGLLKEKVSAIDLIGITAIQVFLPEVYLGIRDNKDIFAGVLGSTYGREESEREQLKKRCDEIIRRAGEFDEEVLREFLQRLFPKMSAMYGNVYASSENWRKEARMCSEEIFDSYFMLTLPEGEISPKEMETILALANNTESFEEALLGLRKDGRVLRFLDRMQDYTRENIPKEHIGNVMTVLMNLGDLLPEREEGLYSLGGTPMELLRIFYQLSERLGSQGERFGVFKTAMGSTEASLYTVVHEVHALGWDHGKHTEQGAKPEGERAVNSAQLDELERLAADKIRLWGKDSRLSKSMHLEFILFAWREWGNVEEAREFACRMVENDEGLIDFIRAFVGEVKSQSMGDYVYRKEYQINMKTVEEFVKVDLIEPRVREIVSSCQYEKMDEEKKRALQTFLEAVDGK
jgi:predicted KAP-like P-loop ATPase